MTLAAGRELDALVAEKVMGLLVIVEDGETNCAPVIQASIDTGRRLIRADLVPCYSTNISVAWLVVERMQDSGWYWSIDYDYGELVAGFYTARDSEGEIDPHFVQAKTVPLAICLAALKAVGEEE